MSVLIFDSLQEHFVEHSFKYNQQDATLYNILYFVSGGSSAHHQELKTVHTASGICHACLLLPLVVGGARWRSG